MAYFDGIFCPILQTCDIIKQNIRHNAIIDGRPSLADAHVTS